MNTDKLPFPSHLPPLPEPPAGHRWVFYGENAQVGSYFDKRNGAFLGEDDKAWTVFKDHFANPAMGCYVAELAPIPTDPDYASREYQKTVLDAAWDGVPCQYFNPGNDFWIDDVGWHSVASSIAQGLRVRIKPVKPAKKRIPLTAEDIPAVCWVRCGSKGTCTDRLVLGVSCNEITFLDMSEKQGARVMPFKHLMLWEYSEDRKNWKAAYKETEE